CPLYFDREFLRRPTETMAVCCAGVGHFVAPIRDEKEEQIGAVVSPAVKFAPNEVEPLAELSFRLKVLPDELLQAAEAVRRLASGFDSPLTQTQVEARRRLTAGVAEWVRHADRAVTVPDIGKSAWCRYLTDDEVQTGSVLGLPIPVADAKATFGAIVVGWDRP